jgi:hypothetical protein
MRENLINRLYDQHAGYWQLDLQGMGHLSQAELGSLLTHYLGLSDTQLARAIEKMLNRGDHELALRTAIWALAQNPSSEAPKMVHPTRGLETEGEASGAQPVQVRCLLGRNPSRNSHAACGAVSNVPTQRSSRSGVRPASEQQRLFVCYPDSHGV